MEILRKLSRVITIISILIAIIMGVVFFSVGKSPACYIPSRGKVKPGLSTRVVTSNEVERCYLLYVPESYSPLNSVPVVISIHGLAGNPQGFRRMTGWDKVAEREGFLVVYPQGSSFPLRWNTSPAFCIEQVDDVQFVEDILKNLDEIAAIETRRIYINGFSQGATLTEMLACDLADKLAAVGMVEGYGDADRLTCDPDRPLPLIALFGTEDVLGKPEEYPAWFYDLMNLSPEPEYIQDLAFDTWQELWISNNNCDPNSRIENTDGGVRIAEYTRCAENADIQLYWLEGAGHTWPGGKNYDVFGETSNDVIATEVLWAFFESHRLPVQYIQE